MQTLFYSILHFLTDGLCAFAMFSRLLHGPDRFLLILVYDFCAFVLQLPIGALMDAVKARDPSSADRLPFVCAVSGALLTAAGAFVHPALLGFGNALFHVGGGIGTIGEDRAKGLNGQALGIFVAPGAMGLFLGTWFGRLVDGNIAAVWILAVSALYLLTFLIFGILKGREDADRALRMQSSGSERQAEGQYGPQDEKKAGPGFAVIMAVALCFIVVVIRSLTGSMTSFSWKTGFLWGVVCTAAVVLGKMAGGILSARLGMPKVMCASLLLSAVCYYFSDVPAAGTAALFFFNMTMPVTLYMIVRELKGLEGFSFGLLTVALFIGVLPACFGWMPGMPANVLGAVMSLLSMALLLAAAFLLKKGSAEERRSAGETKGRSHDS